MNLLLVALAVVALSVFASLMRLIEVTFTRLSRARAAGLDEVDGAEGRLVSLVADRSRVVGPAALMRLLAQAGIIAMLTVVLTDRMGAVGAVVSVAVFGGLGFVFMESTPHRWAIDNNDRMARLLAGTARRISRFPLLVVVSRPLLAMASLISPRAAQQGDPEVGEDELLALAEAAAASDVIDDDEAEIIGSLIELGDTIAREVMVPRPDMITVAHGATVRDAVRLVLDHGFTRVPVAGDGVDDIVGVVLAKDLMRVQLAGRIDDPLEGVGVIRDVRFVPESKRAGELMREMQAERMHLCVVVDEYGGIAGLITLEDIIEELVGEIVDEYDDEVPLVEELDDGTYRVSGKLPMDDLHEVIDGEFPDGEWDTVGGLMLDLLGKVPEQGDAVSSNGHELVAERVDQRRVDSVLIKPAPTDEAPDAGSDGAGRRCRLRLDRYRGCFVKSGFVTFAGRPNAGKSTLLNKILGQKVSIVSNKPQTTRIRVMGVLHRSDAQIVIVDTPGIHKPVSALGEHLNETAGDALHDVDVPVLVVDALAPFGKGDQYVADKLPDGFVVVITKVDRASRQQVVDQLQATSALPASEWFPVSGRTGKGVDAFVEHLVSRMPEGPQYFPDDMVTDIPEAFHVAELVREQLMRKFRAELPYSIATRVVEWEWPRVRCEILVERDSQKGMVIGKGGSVLKEVGTAVREQLPEGAYLELAVRVEKDWQRRSDTVTRLLDPSHGLLDD